jgi:AAA+ ATPase superfamily predicted ATPase
MITDTNPFNYSRPTRVPEDIIDRDSETEKLLKLAVGGHYVRLIAPRKYGKTTLVWRVLRDGQNEGLIGIYVDLYGVLSIADVALRIERAYAAQLKGPIRKTIENFFQNTGLGLSLGAFGVGAKLQIDPKVDPLPALHTLLDLPLRLEEGGGFRALIVFDEFQDITKIKDMDALLRSHIQMQGEVASFIFAGSEPGMMKEIFEDKSRPLYNSGVPIRLGRLSGEDIREHIFRRFEETGRDVGEALSPLVDAAKGHPQRAIQLAHALWERVGEGESATLEDWRLAHTAVIDELSPEFDAHWRRMSVSEQKTLRAVIAGGGRPLRTAELTRLDLDKTTAFKVLKRLIDTADLEKEDRTYLIVDPIFEDWIRRLGQLDLAAYRTSLDDPPG